MQKLESYKKETMGKLDTLAASGISTDIPAALRDYQNYLAAIQSFLTFADSPELKQKIIQRLVHKIEILPDWI